jgi:hypothetical protein
VYSLDDRNRGCDLKKPILCDNILEGPIPSPFKKTIALGYYDGATSGLAQCGNCPVAYRFELIAWNSNQENRIYSLAEIEPQVFESIVHTLSLIEVPRWPYWIPRWQFKSPEEEKRNRDAVELDLQKASTANLVIATDHIGKEIVTCREIVADACDHLPKPGLLPDPSNWKYWQQYLGLKVD